MGDLSILPFDSHRMAKRRCELRAGPSTRIERQKDGASSGQSAWTNDKKGRRFGGRRPNPHSRVACLPAGPTRPRDLDPEPALVVGEVVVVAPEEQLSGRGRP